MATCVLRPIRVIGIVVATLAASGGAGAGALANTAADGCLPGPNSPAPAGEHWYYHVDRAKQRKCWYLRTQSARQTDAQPTLARQPVFTKPPAAAAGAPTQATADGAAVQPDVRSLKPQFAPKISATTDEIVPEKSQEVSSARSIASHPTLQESSEQPWIAAPPLPTPTFTTVQAGSPVTAPSDVQRGNAKAPDSGNAGNTDRKTEPTINGKIAKLPGTSSFIVLILALGLIAGVGGDLWRVAIKLVSAYRGRVHLNRAASKRTAKRRQEDYDHRPVVSEHDQSRQEPDEGYQQQRWYEGQRKQERYEGQQQSLTHPITADDEWPASANEKHASFTGNGKVLKPDDAIARLSHQIDRLLGMPSVDEDPRKQERYEDQQQSLTHPITANDEWLASANEKHPSFASNSRVLKPDDALARLSQEIDWLLQKPRLA